MGVGVQGCELKSDITNFKMLLTKSVQKLFQPTCKLLRASNPGSCRTLTHYPIDDVIFGLTDDERQLREMAFNFCQKELAPLADKMDKTNEFPEMREVWKKMGDLGMLGATASSKYGGSDMGYFQHCILVEEMARVSASISLSYGAHSNLCVNQINKNGTHADTLVVYARTDPNAAKAQHGITAFLIERGMEGFSSGPKLDKLGIRGSGACELIFEDCKVPEKNVLGAVNKGIYVLFSGLDLERLVLAAGPVGILQGVCDVAFSYAHQRKQFNSPIGHFQLIQGKMAEMYVALSSSRCYLYNVAKACDQGHFNNKDCAGVIYYCADQATKVALDGIQILGGNGYINDYPTGRFLRDAKLYEIGAGTQEIRKLIIGRSLNAEYK